MTIGLSIFLLGAELSIIFKNPTTNFGSREKHEKVKSSSPQQQKKKERKIRGPAWQDQTEWVIIKRTQKT